jgi:ribokinase
VVAAVGDDISGRAASVALARAGVVAHLGPSRRPTGSVVALVDADGQRSMLSDRGANLDLGPDALPVGLLAPGRHLHLSGYVLRDEATRPTGRAILAAAGAAGMSRSVDPSARSPATADARAWLSWVAGVEWCCANLAEGQALTGLVDPEGVALALAGHFKEVAVTLGAGGVMVAGGGGPPMRIGALRATVVDTTGAGDAFAGTWLVRRLGGDDVASAAGAALAAAAAAVSSVGSGWDRRSAW